MICVMYVCSRVTNNRDRESAEKQEESYQKRVQTDATSKEGDPQFLFVFFGMRPQEYTLLNNLNIKLLIYSSYYVGLAEAVIIYCENITSL